MNRNVTILIIILIILLIAGYLLWLRSRFQKINDDLPITPTPTVEITITPKPSTGVTGASPSATATPSGKISPSTSLRTSPTVKPVKTSTGSGSSVR